MKLSGLHGCKSACTERCDHPVWTDVCASTELLPEFDPDDVKTDVEPEVSHSCVLHGGWGEDDSCQGS